MIRRIGPEDAAAYRALLDRVNSETEFMLHGAGELTWTPEQYVRFLAEAERMGSYVAFVCDAEAQLVGFVFGRRNNGQRQAHVLHLGLGVLQAWVGKGIGRSLMLALEEWAGDNGYHRLELQVQVHNARAIVLYESLGYEREGLRRHGFRIDGSYVDLFYMSKLIGAQKSGTTDEHR